MSKKKRAALLAQENKGTAFKSNILFGKVAYHYPLFCLGPPRRSNRQQKSNKRTTVHSNGDDEDNDDNEEDEDDGAPAEVVHRKADKVKEKQKEEMFFLLPPVVREIHPCELRQQHLLPPHFAHLPVLHLLRCYL